MRAERERERKVNTPNKRTFCTRTTIYSTDYRARVRLAFLYTLSCGFVSQRMFEREIRDNFNINRTAGEQHTGENS